MVALTGASANCSPPVAECTDTGSSQTKALSALPVNVSSQNMQGIAKPIPPKGRFASKLSSRHNRRKRRERENKPPSAKKSRGAKRNRDRIPIPSFTPIAEEYHDERAVGVEGNSRVSETLSACPTDRGSDTTKPIADTAVKADAFMNNNATNLTDETQKIVRSHGIDKVTDEPACAAVPAQSEQTCVKKQKIMHTKDESQAAEVQQRQNTEPASSGDSAAGQSRECLHQTVKQKKSSGDPSKTSAGTLTSASSTSGAAPEKVKEQPSAPIVAQKSASSECLPAAVEQSERVSPQRDNNREENNSGEGKVKGADKRLLEDDTKNHPRDTTLNDKVETPGEGPPKETVSNLEMGALPVISSVNKAKSLVLNESSPPPLVQQADKKHQLCSNNVDKCVGNVGEKVNHRSEYVGSAKSGLPEENNSGEGKVDKETCLDVNNDTKNYPRNEAPNDNAKTPGEDPPKKTESGREMEALPINSSVKKAKSSTLNESTLVRQVDKKHKLSSDNDNKSTGNAGSKKSKCSKYFGSDNSGPPEVIEIIDDDDDIRDGAMPKAKKERSLNNTTPDKKTGALGKKRKPNKSNQTKKKRKAPASISRSSSDSSSEDDTKRAKKTSDRKGAARRRNQTVKIKECKSPKQSKTSAGNKLCFACSSCKCDSRAGTAATPQKSSSLSGSDARVEQSLVNRLQRIERDISWKEGQRNKVARELKKRRGQMIKKWEGQSSNTRGQRPRFLADAELSDLGGSHSKISSKEINRAQSRIFGKQKTHQPTLTQILGRPKGKDGDEKPPEFDCNGESNAKDAPENANTLNAHGASSPDGDDNFLAFWADSVPIEDSTQCIGSMNYFNRAAANFKEMKCTGKWAKATASTLQIEEEEGFDALVDLFDASMENNRSDRYIGCSQNPIDDDDLCMIGGSLSPITRLTPEGERVAKEIETSVKDDPQKMAAIERMCPNWKENIQLAQAQTDPNDLYNALQSVQQAKTDLENTKERILQAFIDRHQTLNLYEKSLQGSIDRLSENEGEDDFAD